MVGETVALFGGRRFKLDPVAISDGRSLPRQQYDRSADAPIAVAVGTTIADRPPHRSVRARLRIRLLPRMSSGKVCLRTPCNPGTRVSRSVSGDVRLNDVLLGPRPSLPHLRRRLPFFVRLVHRYYGAVRLLLNVHVRRSVYGLRGPVLIWLTKTSRRSPGSRACCFSACAGS